MDALKWIILAAAAVLSLVLLVALGPWNASPHDRPIPTLPPPVSQPDSAALVVNGQSVSREEFEAAYAQLIENYTRFYQQYGQDFSQQLQGEQGAHYQLELRSGLVDTLVRQTLVQQEIQSRGIQVSPAEVETALQSQFAEILSQNELTEEQADEILKRQGSSLVAFKEELRRQVEQDLLQTKLKQAVAGPIAVTDETLLQYVESERDRYLETLVQVEPVTQAETLGYYQLHQDEFLQLHARHILIRVEEGAPQEQVRQAQDRIEALKAQLDEGADFAELAKTFSEDPGSGAQGGDLGFFGRGQMVESFEAAAYALPVGQVSAPVRSPFGFHLILVEETRVQPFEEVLEQVRQQLTQERQEAEVGALLAKARSGDAESLARVKAAAQKGYVEQRQDQLFEIWFGVIEQTARTEIRMPLVAAFRLEAGDLDAAIAAYEQIQVQGLVEDPYLGYYLCQLYPRRYERTQQSLRELEAKPSLTSEETQALQTLRANLPLFQAQAQGC